MTNILAAIVICVVTNVTTEQVVIGNRPTACPATDGYQYGCLVYHCENVYSDTERDQVTTVREVSTLAFNWLGAQRTVTHERILSRVVQRERKQDGWEPVEKAKEQNVEDQHWINMIHQFGTITNFTTNVNVGLTIGEQP